MVLEKLKQGDLSQAERKRLAQKAFQHVAAYDTSISQYLRQDMEGPRQANPDGRGSMTQRRTTAVRGVPVRQAFCSARNAGSIGRTGGVK